MRRAALFDVDCREFNAVGDGLAFRPRVEPLADKLRALYDCAARHGLPLVFSTCWSGRMLQPDSLPGVLFVPLDPSRREWLDGLDAARLIYVEKRTYDKPGLNYACRAFDIFANSSNAARLALTLAVEEWVVFGNGFDLCVNGVVRGLLATGRKVRLLEDVTWASAEGYGDHGETGTPTNRRRILDEMAALGVRLETGASFLAEMAS